MKRKEILKTLHKIKWDGKISKLPQIGKLLKTALVSPKIDPTLVLDYLLMENATFKYIYMCQDSNDDFLLENCDLGVVKKLVESCEPIVNVSHPFIHEILGLDIACLDIILCYMYRKYDDVFERFATLNNEYCVTQLTFEKFSLYSMKLVAEAISYYIATCLRLDRDFSNELALFSLNTFMELCDKFGTSISYTKRRILTSSIPRMHVYVLISLRLYVASVSKENNFMFNITACLNLYQLLSKIASSVDIKLENLYYERYVYAPLTILLVQVMVCCWSSTCSLPIQENENVMNISRRRSKTVGDHIENIDPNAQQQSNLVHVADCARYIVNYLGKLYLTCSDFRLANMESSINQFVSLLMVIYIIYIPSAHLADISFDGMKCGYKNRYLHFCFGSSALAGKKYILSRSSFESLMDFSSLDEFNDQLQISSLLLLLSNYINNTGQIDKAIDVIEQQILPYRQQLPTYSLALVYLAYSICYLYKSRYGILCGDNRSTYLRQALTHINQAYEMDDGDGEIVFYRAYVCAKLGQIDDAFDDVQLASQLLPTDPRPCQLLGILYCCEKRYGEAYRVVSDALACFPTNNNLLYLKIKLLTYNHHETQLKNTFIEFNEMIRYTDRYLSRFKLATQSKQILNNIIPTGLSSYSCGIRRDETAADTIYSTLSKANLDSFNKNYYNQSVSTRINTGTNNLRTGCFRDTKYNIDLISMKNVHDIQSNLYFAIWEVAYELQSTMAPGLYNQIMVLYPDRPETIYMQEFLNFKSHSKEPFYPSDQFLQYLTLYPRHPRLVYLYLKILENQLCHSNNTPVEISSFSLREAELLNSLEYYAKVIVEVDEFNYKSWKILGETLFKLNRYEEAANALSNALEIETIQPFVSFDTVPLIFRSSDY